MVCSCQPAAGPSPQLHAPSLCVLRTGRRVCCWLQVKGMGEKQIEVDRRLLKGRMARLRRDIEEVSGHPHDITWQWECQLTGSSLYPCVCLW